MSTGADLHGNNNYHKITIISKKYERSNVNDDLLSNSTLLNIKGHLIVVQSCGLFQLPSCLSTWSYDASSISGFFLVNCSMILVLRRTIFLLHRNSLKT